MRGGVGLRLGKSVATGECVNRGKRALATTLNNHQRYYTNITIILFDILDTSPMKESMKVVLFVLFLFAHVCGESSLR